MIPSVEPKQLDPFQPLYSNDAWLRGASMHSKLSPPLMNDKAYPFNQETVSAIMAAKLPANQAESCQNITRQGKCQPLTIRLFHYTAVLAINTQQFVQG